MASSNDPRELRLHFDGPKTDGHTLPAEILVNSIQHVQRIVHLLAKEHRGEPPGKRLRVSADIKERFALVCKLPVAGGYGLPVAIGEPATGVVPDDEVLAVSERFQMVSRSLARDRHAFDELMPDARYGDLVLDAFKGTQPPPHLGMELTIEDGQGNPILRHSHLQEVSGPPPETATPSPVERGRVVGKLLRMAFATKSIELEYRGERTLKATYADQAEAALLRHPRGLIQIRGNIRYDAAGEPVSIADIDQVADVDESPMEVKEFIYGNVRYVPTTPLHFDVAFDRADALYDLQGPFDVMLSADSREDLADALRAELNLLFEDYAEGDPARLSPGAKKLRDQIRDRFGIR